MTVVPSPGLGTFSVDRAWRMYVDPEAVEQWTTDEIAVVWLHECLHLLRDHAAAARQLDVSWTDRLRWNLAADAEINDDLAGDGHVGPGTPVTPGRLGQPD